MHTPAPVTLEGHGVRLEPLTQAHHDGLVAAASDGCLWQLWFTSVPQPAETAAYIDAALAGQAAGHMLPWAVRDLASRTVVGCTRYHDIVTAVDRVEIGYTWYGKTWQRSHVNTACKLLLLDHAFGTLRCEVVGLRTDNFNFASQRAIAALGAKPDGVIRHHQARRGWHRARHRHVQHPGRGMAGRATAPRISDRTLGSTRQLDNCGAVSTGVLIRWK